MGRGMANCPVDSMKGGGLSWFSDLTVAYPYYILPLLTSATLFIQFKLGVEYGTKLSQSTGAGKALVHLPSTAPDLHTQLPSRLDLLLADHQCHLRRTGFVSEGGRHKKTSFHQDP